MSSQKARLLIVDDNLRNRDILSRQLLRSGFDVDTAEDGRTALAMLAEEDFDLVLLDLMMPEIDGMEVLRRVRMDEALKDIRIIMVSASDRSEDMVEAFKTGVNDYVVKPIDFPVVLARIKMHLSQLTGSDDIPAQRTDEPTDYMSRSDIENILKDQTGRDSEEQTPVDTKQKSFAIPVGLLLAPSLKD